MDRNNALLALVTVILFVFGSIAFAVETSPASPIGYWKTIDDTTGRPKSIIKIWKSNDQMLMGKVIKIFPKQGNDQAKVCTACKGENHNQPIVGMVILSQLKNKQAHWADGKILDPENGKTYSCSLRTTAAGRKLNVHGYVGLPLFGRSQTWERVDLMSG